MARAYSDRVKFRAGTRPPYFKVVFDPPSYLVDECEVDLTEIKRWLSASHRPGSFILTNYRIWRPKAGPVNSAGISLITSVVSVKAAMITTDPDLAFEFKMRWA